MSVDSARALYNKLPPNTSHFVQKGDLGHDFSSPVAFETLRHELTKLVDTVTKNWAGKIYMEKKKTQVKLRISPPVTGSFKS